MTTATLQLKRQRSRFANHLLTAVAGAFPAGLRDRLLRPSRPLSPSEAAALEAQEVRRMASTYSRTDPGFAADLYAAAARHESLSSH